MSAATTHISAATTQLAGSVVKLDTDCCLRARLARLAMEKTPVPYMTRYMEDPPNSKEVVSILDFQ